MIHTIVRDLFDRSTSVSVWSSGLGLGLGLWSWSLRKETQQVRSSALEAGCTGQAGRPGRSGRPVPGRPITSSRPGLSGFPPRSERTHSPVLSLLQSVGDAGVSLCPATLCKSAARAAIEKYQVPQPREHHPRNWGSRQKIYLQATLFDSFAPK